MTTFTKPDVVGLAQQLPFYTDSFDSVLCTQVIEHVPEPWVMLKEIYRVICVLEVSCSYLLRRHGVFMRNLLIFIAIQSMGCTILLQEAGLQVVEIIPQGSAWLLLGQILNMAEDTRKVFFVVVH